MATTATTSTAFNSQVLNQVNGTSSTSTSGTSTTAADLQSNFMTLLVTQLKNQDPLKPLENSELTSQLAQINTLDGIESLNTTLKSITGQIDAGQMMQATSLVGHSVLVPGDRLLVGDSAATTPFGFELGSAADSVTVSILDGSGNVVRQFDLGAMQAGVESFSWDATLTNGGQAPSGSYRVKIEATSEGKAVTSTALTYGEVGSVASSAKGPLLDLGATLGRVELQDVRQIL